MNNRVLLYIDNENVQASLDLIDVIEKLYSLENVEIFAFSVGKSNLIKNKVHYLFQCDNKTIDYFNIKEITLNIKQLVEEYKFSTILIPATWCGRMIAPRLAMALKTGLVADVTEVKNENGIIKMIRPAFDGKILAEIVNTQEGPIMMSVRPGVFKFKKHFEVETKIINYKLIETKKEIELLEVKEKEKSTDIREANILVSGGGGMEKNFSALDILANKLGGMKAASRRIVDSNLASRTIQVGQSGKIVSPKLYFAIGIYGSLQHIEGLKNVEHIISVNTNKDAPICSLSDIVVVGDGEEFIKLLVKRIDGI